MVKNYRTSRKKTDGWIEKGNDETHAEFHFA
jgi:hypothetical protein